MRLDVPVHFSVSWKNALPVPDTQPGLYAVNGAPCWVSVAQA